MFTKPSFLQCSVYVLHWNIESCQSCVEAWKWSENCVLFYLVIDVLYSVCYYFQTCAFFFFFKFVFFLIYKSGWIKLIHSYFYFCCCISPYDWLQDHLIIFFCLSHTGHVLYYMPGLCIFAYLDSLAVILIARVTLVISDNPGFSIHVHVKGWYWHRSAMTNTDECTSQGW